MSRRALDEVTDMAARAKKLDRAFAWCPKCTGGLRDGRCPLCDDEEERQVRFTLESSVRQVQHRAIANRCVDCDGSGALPSSFGGLAPCWRCGGKGVR